MDHLKEDLLDTYSLQHLKDRPKELYRLGTLVNQMTSIRYYRDHLEKRMSVVGWTKNDLLLLDTHYARLDKLNRELFAEIQRLQSL